MAKIISSEESSRPLQGWVVCITASIFFFYYFVQVTVFNTISPDLIKTFSLNAESLGILSSLLLWGATIFILPVGILLDHFSVKKIIILMLSISVLGTLIFSFAHHLWVAEWARFFVGVGVGAAFLPCIKLASHWFASHHFAMVTGIIMTIGFLGGLVGQTPMVLLVDAIGWRNAVFIDGCFGIFLLILMIFIVQDYPEGVVLCKNIQGLADFFRNLKISALNRQTWLYGFYICLINLPIFVFSAAFGNHYLQQSFQLSEVQASFANLLLIFGVIIASPILGWCSDRIGRRKPLMITGAIFLIVLMLILMYAPIVSARIIYLLFFLVGFVSTAQTIGYPAVAESNYFHAMSTSTAIAGTLVFCGGAFFLSFFGGLLEMHWSGKIVAGIQWHSVSEYRFALWSLPIAFFVGLISVLFAKETYCKRKI